MTLRDVIVYHTESAGISLSDATVMSNQTDPYRIDTPANHRDAAWLAQALFDSSRPWLTQTSVLRRERLASEGGGL